jgi:hypothetical protein
VLQQGSRTIASRVTAALLLRLFILTFEVQACQIGRHKEAKLYIYDFDLPQEKLLNRQ